MKIKSQTFSQASGSMAGLTASRNKGGMYMRARAVPVNPNTPAQQRVRNAMSQLTSNWSGLLTDVQRAAWATYAANTPIIDTLGNSINLSGNNMYIRGNSPRLQAGLTLISDGPADFGLPTFVPITVIAHAATQHIAVTYDNTDDWANQDDGAMLVYASKPQAITINYFKGPFRLVGSIAGNSVTPPTPPASLAATQAFTLGQKLFVRINVVDDEGRLSSDQIISTIAVT